MMAITRSLGEGELRLLRRLSLNPSLRQVDIAKDLGISRCALNQSWRRLEKLYQLRIRSDIDYGHFGLHYLFGWASSKLGSEIINKFYRWLKTSHFVIKVIRSKVSSTMKNIVYFEVVIPSGSNYTWFCSQLNRFRKKPYKLNVISSEVKKAFNQLNPGKFDGVTWEFEDGFRFEASIEATREYIDVLPSSKKIVQSKLTNQVSLIDLVIVTSLEARYHVPASLVSKTLNEVGIKSPSTRTLRRHLSKIRKRYVMPYVDISNIGLTQLMIICIKEQSSEGTISRLLEAQVGIFPQSRFLSGNHLTVLQLQLPEEVDWFKISQMLSQQIDPITEIFTFIATESHIQTNLESVLGKIIEESKRKS